MPRKDTKLKMSSLKKARSERAKTNGGSPSGSHGGDFVEVAPSQPRETRDVAVTPTTPSASNRRGSRVHQEGNNSQTRFKATRETKDSQPRKGTKARARRSSARASASARNIRAEPSSRAQPETMIVNNAVNASQNQDDLAEALQIVRLSEGSHFPRTELLDLLTHIPDQESQELLKDRDAKEEENGRHANNQERNGSTSPQSAARQQAGGDAFRPGSSSRGATHSRVSQNEELAQGQFEFNPEVEDRRVADIRRSRGKRKVRRSILHAIPKE